MLLDSERSYWTSGVASRHDLAAAYNPAPKVNPTPRWRNWQTHYFEVVAPQGVQVQILSWAFSHRLACDVGGFFRRQCGDLKPSFTAPLVRPALGRVEPGPRG